MKPRVPLFVLALALWLAPGLAAAHQNSVTYLDLTVEGRAVEAVFRVESLDLNEPLGVSAGRDVTAPEALRGAPALGRYLASRLRVTNAGHACPASAAEDARVRPRDRSFELAVTLRYECPHAVEALDVRYDLFFDIDQRHQGLATVRAFGGTSQQVFRDATRDLRLRHARPLAAQLAQYVALGVEHIFLGYDHVAFLVGLLLAAGALGLRRGGRHVVAVVTAFTAAHSCTLVASALGWVALPPSLVEPAIALSILYVAVENLLPREPRGRWALTFAFGLVHGFGFASVLSELGLPARGLVPSLLAFNVGVELGQLAVVAAAFPVLHLLARGGWRARELCLVALGAAVAFAVLARAGVPRATLALVLFAGVPALFAATRRWGYARAARRGASLALAALAALWFVERVTGWSALGGALG